MANLKKLLKYRLEPLLEIKKRAKKQAEIRLAKAIAKLEQEKKKLKKLEQEKQKIIERKKECRREFHDKVSAGAAKVQDGSIRVNYLRKLEEDQKEKEQEIEMQKQTIEACETEVKRAKRDYINAANDLRVMEKHKELWRKKVNKELSRLEEVEMDELGNAIHQLRNVA